MKRSASIPLLCAFLTFSLLPGTALAAPNIDTTKTILGPIESFTLPNGLKVILKESHAAPVVTWAVHYKVGSRNEAVGCTGATHLLEHMMFKGTKFFGKGQIAQLLSRNGASFNASTGPDQTNYYETYSSDKLEMGIRLEADRMRNSLILDSERQSEMTVVRNEMERNESNPSRALMQDLLSHAFKAHPYHHPTIGWRSDVEGIRTERLKQFYDTFYHPNNAVAVLVGDFKTKEAAALIERYFGKLPAARNIPPMYTVEEPQGGTNRFTLHRRGETNLVQSAWHIPSSQSKDIAPLLVLENLLGYGQTSRLNRALVETQLATEAWSYCGVQRDPSLFQLGLTLRPGVAPEKAEKALMKEIERLKSEPVSEQDLQDAKNQSEADYIYQNDGTAGLAMMLGKYEVIAGNWRRGIDLLEEIKNVQPKDLQKAAKAYFNDDNLTVGWYVSSPDGPMRALPKNAGSGKAVSSNTVKPLPYLDFEKRVTKAPKLTLPVRKVLSNGMTVLVLENKNNPTVSICGFIRAGGALDPKGKDGLADLTAEMLDKGTSKRDKLSLAKDLESLSASIGYSGRVESAGISGGCLAKDLDRTLEVLSEELSDPVFPAEELSKVKANWISSIKQAEEKPEVRARRAFNHEIFQPGHPYYDQDPAAKIRAIEEISREDLKAFHAAHYGPNAVTLTVVGDVKAEEVFSKLEKCFANWKAVTVSPFHIPDVAATDSAKVLVPMMDKSNVAIFTGNPTAIHRQDPDYYAATAANYILGGDPLAARLGVKLRDEMGLTYSVGSSISPAYGASPWNATITVNPANVKTALDALQREIERFVKQGITPAELAKTKSAFIGNLAVGLSTNWGMAASLSNIEFYNLGTDYWSRYPELIRGLSLEEVNRAARRMIQPGKLDLSIAGPYQER